MKVLETRLEIAKPTDITRSSELPRRELEDIGRIIKNGKDNLLRVLLAISIVAAGASCGKKEVTQGVMREGRIFKSAPDISAAHVDDGSSKIAELPAESDASAVQISTQDTATQLLPADQAEVEPEKFEKYSVRIKEGDSESIEHKREKYYYVDEDGENIFGDVMFSQAGPFKKGVALAVVWSSGVSQYCFINKNGENIFGDKEFEEASQFRNGMALIKETGNEGRWYFTKRNGENAFGKDFIHAEGFREGLAAVCQEENCYFIDEKGENAFGDKKFEEVVSFSEGLGIVKENGKYYYINKNGENQFGQKRFTNAEPFHKGIAKVTEGIRPYVMNKSGRQIKMKR